MKNKNIILAFSGGLDTSFCLKRLSSDGLNVHAVLVNTGGFNKQEINNIKKQAIQLGASKFISCLLYTSPSPRDLRKSRMPSSA